MGRDKINKQKEEGEQRRYWSDTQVPANKAPSEYKNVSIYAGLDDLCVWFVCIKPLHALSPPSAPSGWLEEVHQSTSWNIP